MHIYRELSEEEKWSAVINCNAEYDGVFYFAVKTTGIFCRPSCKAKLPKRENILFFNSAEEAIKDGYRPCKLCRPDIMECHYDPSRSLVKNLEEKINREYNKQFNIEVVSRELGVSSSHLARLFKIYTGKTPNQYITSLRIDMAKQLLCESKKDIFDIAMDTGYKSISNFYKNFKELTGCTPMEFRRNNSGGN